MKLQPAATFYALCQGFGGLGFDIDALLADTDLDPAVVASEDGWVPDDAYIRLWEAVRRIDSRETLPTEVGYAIPVGAFGIVDFLCGSAPTVGASIETLGSYCHILLDGFQVSAHADGTGVTVRLHSDNTARELREETTVAVMLGRFREMGVHPPEVFEVGLLRPAPQDPAAFERLLGAPTYFGQATTRMRFSVAGWNTPNRTADPALNSTLRQLARKLSLGPEKVSPLEAAVRARLRAALEFGTASADEIASSLALSPRTLHRRLSETGRTFRQIVDDYRRDECLRLLREANLPLGRIAERLGYDEQASLNRAFRRWTGSSPRQWRDRELVPG